MKIAVLSDIHSNLLALESVLEDIQKQGCEKILFLGDYVHAGPEPIDTLNLIMTLSERENIEVIQGNTDLMIAEYNEEIYNKVAKFAPVMANALKADVEVLGEKQKSFLRKLPPNKELIIDGIKILMVHGSPRRNDENIMPNMSLEEVEEMISKTDADIILCGHTHIPCGYQTNTRQTIVNDGSVGRPFTETPESCYVIITTLGNGEFEVEHNFVKYDNYQSAKVLARRGFDGADKIAQILINPTQRHL